MTAALLDHLPFLLDGARIGFAVAVVVALFPLAAHERRRRK